MAPKRGSPITEALKSHSQAQAEAEEAWTGADGMLDAESVMLHLRAISYGINASVLLLKGIYASMPVSGIPAVAPEIPANTHNKHDKHVYSDSKQGDDDALLSSGQAARESGYSKSTLRRWSNEGKLEVHRTPGGQRRFRRSDLQNIHQKQI